MKSEPAGYDRVRLPTADRTLDLLELLSSSSEGLSLAEISRHLQIPKSTAHYLIQTLLTRDYIRLHCSGHTYIIGPSVSRLANMSEAERQLSILTRSELREITDKLKLVAMLASLRGAQAVLIGREIPSGGEDGGAWTGHQNDVHCTSLGKALIAYLSDSELESLLCNRPLAKFTPNTISSVKRLQEHLVTVREQGYAVNNEEHIAGVRGVAAPVFNQLGKVIAAVGVMGSSAELPRWRIPVIGKELISTAVLLSRKTLEGRPLET